MAGYRDATGKWVENSKFGELTGLAGAQLPSGINKQAIGAMQNPGTNIVKTGVDQIMPAAGLGSLTIKDMTALGNQNLGYAGYGQFGMDNSNIPMTDRSWGELDTAGKFGRGLGYASTAADVIGGLGSLYYTQKNLELQEDRDDYLKSRDKMADAKVAKAQSNYDKTVK